MMDRTVDAPGASHRGHPARSRSVPGGAERDDLNGTAASAPTAATASDALLAARPLVPAVNIAEVEAMAQLVANGRIPPGGCHQQDGRVPQRAATASPTPTPAARRCAHGVPAGLAVEILAGTVTGILVNDGLLRWDSQIVDYVPDFRFDALDAAQQVTVADLLSHRVGLTHNAYDRDLEANADVRKALTMKMANAPMTCAPGECYAYQNVAWLSLTGDIAATGPVLQRGSDRRIFKHSGMHDASYGPGGPDRGQRALGAPACARAAAAGCVARSRTTHRSPAAGVNASISDMAQWLIAQSGTARHAARPLAPPFPPWCHAGELRGSSWRHARA